MELIEELKRRMKPTDTVNLEVVPSDLTPSSQKLLLYSLSSCPQGSFQCLHPNSKQKTRCQSCLPCRFYNLIGQLCHRNTEALVKGQPGVLACLSHVCFWLLELKSCLLTATKASLNALRKRLHVLKYHPSSSYSSPAPPPLFRVSIQLSIPNIVLRPSLDDIQVRSFCPGSSSSSVELFDSCHYVSGDSEQAGERAVVCDQRHPSVDSLSPAVQAAAGQPYPLTHTC